MELSIEWQAILIGILIGVVCVGGLSLGVKLLMDAGQPDERKSRLFRYIVAALILASQLLAAMLLLFKTPWVRTSPLGVGLGIVLSILLFSTLMNSLFNRK